MAAIDIVPHAFADEDTYRILDIALVFLGRYFGHSPAEAERFMAQFFGDHAERFDEDAIHFHSSYRLAAMMHYLYHEQGTIDDLGNWLTSKGYHQTPPDALEYFREHYFS